MMKKMIMSGGGEENKTKKRARENCSEQGSVKCYPRAR